MPLLGCADDTWKPHPKLRICRLPCRSQPALSWVGSVQRPDHLQPDLGIEAGAQGKGTISEHSWASGLWGGGSSEQAGYTGTPNAAFSAFKLCVLGLVAARL